MSFARLSVMRACAVVGLAGLVVAACSSTKNFNNDGGTDGGNQFGDSSLPDGTPACATGQYAAQQQPAAMLVLLQKSGSMGGQNQWAFAAQAIVQALDAPVFDTMTLGLIAAPSTTTPGPACIANLPVACGVPPFPQVDLTYAGTNKSSDSSGVRHDIKSWLSTNSPDTSIGEGNPFYDAIHASLNLLQAWPGPGKRLLFVVTDGAISCSSISTRTANAFNDGNGCPDWENPNNIITLVNTANIDPTTPVDTFIVGVPGSDTYDPSGVNFPPYHMRAALSDIAYAGSPANVPTGCTHTNPFHPTTKSDGTLDPDPTTSCHFDMTQNYTAAAVAAAIAKVRGQELGCIFNLPQPEGGTIDPTKVNVSYAVNGGSQNDLFKRATPSEDCSVSGCWDYTTTNQVELYGKACTDIMAATAADVEITVGCATVVK